MCIFLAAAMTMGATSIIIVIVALKVALRRTLAEITGESDETNNMFLRVFDYRIVGGRLEYFSGGHLRGTAE
jgi:prolipoprotein diacylglyceryltransferase